MGMAELENKVNNLRELRRMADELEAEIAATTDELKAYMTANATDELMGHSFHISWKNVTSSRLDSKAMKAELPDIYQRYSKTTTVRRFVLA